MQPERELQRRRWIVVLGIADDVLGKRQLFEPVSCHRNVNDGHVGKYPIAELRRELKRGKRVGDDDANAALAVLAPQEIGFCRSVRLERRPFVVEVLGKKRDRTREALGHDGSQRVFDHDLRRGRPLVAVEDQHTGGGATASAASEARTSRAAERATRTRARRRSS